MQGVVETDAEGRPVRQVSDESWNAWWVSFSSNAFRSLHRECEDETADGRELEEVGDRDLVSSTTRPRASGGTRSRSAVRRY